MNLPDIVVTETGTFTDPFQRREGVDLNSTGLAYGNVYAEAGGLIAAEGDTLRITIRPEAGKQFQISNGFNSLTLRSFFALDLAPLSIGLPIEQNTSTVVFNGMSGGVIPAFSTTNSFYESPAATPPPFIGAVVNQGGLSSIVPFDTGGDVTFDSITLEMENLVPLSWDSSAFEQLGLWATYPTSNTTGGFTIVNTVPEPSVSCVAALGLLMFGMKRRR